MTIASAARAIELRNQAESMVYQAERTLSDYGDKVPSELKADLEGKIAAVRDILEHDRENIDRLDARPTKR